VSDVSPETVFLYVNIVSVAVMTLIAVDTWYVNRFKKPKPVAPWAISRVEILLRRIPIRNACTLQGRMSVNGASTGLRRGQRGFRVFRGRL
jgi:hypothetical protein